MNSILTALRVLLVMIVLTGIAYPLAVTGIAQTAFPSQANGSLIEEDGQIIGSRLLGQRNSDPAFFWGRPSAGSYDPMAAAGSNLGPTHPELRSLIEERAQELRLADPGNDSAIPIELLTASASGLDPHITPEAALYQAPRIARLRSVSENALHTLIEKYTVRSWLGPDVVNVLELNRALNQELE